MVMDVDINTLDIWIFVYWQIYCLSNKSLVKILKVKIIIFQSQK